MLLTVSKYQKTLFKTFFHSTLFFLSLFQKYQHLLALKPRISEMRGKIKKVAVAFGIWPLSQKLHSNFFLEHSELILKL